MGLSMGVLQAQQHLSIPYSRFGWGEMQPRTSAAVRGMGRTAYAYADAICVNASNPASYIRFDSLSSVIDAAFSFQSHVLYENSARQSGSTAFMDYLYIGLPVTSHWSTAFGLQPFSVVNYNYSRTEEPCTRHDQGTGGTYELFWGNAWEISHYFSVGLQASYLFGTGNRLHELLFDDNSYINVKTEDISRVRGLLLNTGLQAWIPIGKKKLGLAAVYSPSIPALLRVEHQVNRVSYQLSGSSESPIDTLAWSASDKEVSKQRLTNPTVLGCGISLAEEEHFWTGFDFTWTGWSGFSNGTSDSLRDACRVSWGARLIPQINSSRYWKKMSYTFGLFYERDYVVLPMQEMWRNGLTVGISFPMRKSKTRVSAYAEFGNYRGAGNSGIREQYTTLTLQVQLHEKWYQRRKLD